MHQIKMRMVVVVVVFVVCRRVVVMKKKTCQSRTWLHIGPIRRRVRLPPVAVVLKSPLTRLRLVLGTTPLAAALQTRIQ